MEKINSIIKQIETNLFNIANSEYAKKANDYLLNQFKLIGIYTPKRKEIVKPFLKAEINKSELIHMVNYFWNHNYRDFKYIAVSFLKKHHHLLSLDELPWLQSLALYEPWWDSIDSLAPIIGKLVKNLPKNPMDTWVENESFWIKRIAIIHQLGFKKDTDIERLTQYTLKQSDNKEFFIRKAIGWAFRDYARHNPTFVKEFMEKHKDKFSSLSYREATKYI